MNEERKKCLYFGSINKEYIYIVLMTCFSLSSIILQIVLSNLDKEKENNNEKALGMNPLFLIWVMYLAESFIPILYLIQRKRTKRFSIDGPSLEIKNISNLHVIPKKGKLSVILTLLGLFLLDGFSSAIDAFMINGNNSLVDCIMKFLFLLFSTLLSIIILKYHYYRHHSLGIIVYCVGFSLFSFVNFQNTSDDIIQLILYSIIGQIITAFKDVVEKYLIDKKYVSPFIVIGFEGIFGFICVSIMFIPFSYIECNFDFCKSNEYLINLGYILNYIVTNSKYLLTYCCLFIVLFLLNTFKFLVLQYFSPTHKIMCDAFTTFALVLIKLNFSYFQSNTYTTLETSLLLASNVIMFIGTLFFLEVIIIGRCGMNKYTKDSIMIRSDEVGPMIIGFKQELVGQDD